jgi:hypothetical protein
MSDINAQPEEALAAEKEEEEENVPEEGEEEAEEEGTNKTTKAKHGLSAIDIGALLKSSGPVVKCVVLRHMSPSGKDLKPHAASPKADESHRRRVLPELVEEVDIDTTPSKCAVKQVLGGPFTFVGQYADEGIVVISRQELPSEDELNELPLSKIRGLCSDFDLDITTLLEKSDLISALIDAQLPVNPHMLQPPFDKQVIRGDILLMRIAETDESLDKNEHIKDNDVVEETETSEDGKTLETSEDSKAIETLSNEEFFLNYTRDEWITFASRTDVVAPEITEGSGDEEDEDYEQEDEEDEDFVLGEDDDDEEGRRAMLHVILAEVIKQFREENGRGPDSEELLELRAQVADQLGVQLPSSSTSEEKIRVKKRSSSEGDETSSEHQSKKVKFDPNFIDPSSDKKDGKPEENGGDEEDNLEGEDK